MKGPIWVPEGKTKDFIVSSFTFWPFLRKVWQGWFLNFPFVGALYRCMSKIWNCQHNAIGSWGADWSSKSVGWDYSKWTWPLWSLKEHRSCQSIQMWLILMLEKVENCVPLKFQLPGSCSSPQTVWSKIGWNLALWSVQHPYKGGVQWSIKGTGYKNCRFPKHKIKL